MIEVIVSEEAKEGWISMHVENERIRSILIQIETPIERERRMKRKKNLMIKGLRVNSETGEE